MDHKLPWVLGLIIAFNNCLIYVWLICPSLRCHRLISIDVEEEAVHDVAFGSDVVFGLKSDVAFGSEQDVTFESENAVQDISFGSEDDVRESGNAHKPCR